MQDSQALLEKVAENAEMGKNTLEQILPMCDDAAFREELQTQQDGYFRINERAHEFMDKWGGEVKGQSAWAKMSTSMGITMETIMDKSTRKLAEMLVQGSNMGIVDCVQTRKQYPHAAPEAVKLSEELERFQQNNIERLKPYL